MSTPSTRLDVLELRPTDFEDYVDIYVNGESIAALVNAAFERSGTTRDTGLGWSYVRHSEGPSELPSTAFDAALRFAPCAGRVILTICGCNTQGCSDLTIKVSVTSDRVCWSEFRTHIDAKVKLQYQFDRTQYLTAIELANRQVESKSATTFFANNGFHIVKGRLDPNTLSPLQAECDRLQSVVHSTAGIRDVLAKSNALAAVERLLRPLAAWLTGTPVFPVRSILFDKTPETNWDVVWHQDVTIAAKERKDVDGFGPWSVKQGVPHVQPPVAVLEKMVTLRLHLDDCPAENGPLLVVPGSHTRGFIDVRTLDTAECDRDAVACVVNAGDVVAMRPLILHASRKSLVPNHRRVLHIDYACEPLPGGLEWA